MDFCITIGCYKLHQFVELCIKRCQTLFGADVPILLVDDASEVSPKIEELSLRYDCAYLRSQKRRSHFSGDIQVFIAALKFVEDIEADVVIKLSQRMIPVLPAFKDAVERVFRNPSIQVALPGRPALNQIARPSAKFYSKFGILTDAVAIRRGAISPEDFLEVYRTRVTRPKHRSDSFAETTWGWLLAKRFPGQHSILPEWTNHVPFQPKIYLRKSQANTADYAKVAAMEGLSGDWDLREWGHIEGKEYVAIPTAV